MGLDGIEIEDGQSEAEAIIEFVESSHKDTKCIAYSYDDETGVYLYMQKSQVHGALKMKLRRGGHR